MSASMGRGDSYYPPEAAAAMDRIAEAAYAPFVEKAVKSDAKRMKRIMALHDAKAEKNPVAASRLFPPTFQRGLVGVHGLTSEVGKKLNGKIGWVLRADPVTKGTATGEPRVAVHFINASQESDGSDEDGEQAKSIKV